MGTTADKLEYLQGTKAAIKQAIVNKGVAVPDGTTFRGYAEKIGAIIDVPDLSNPGAAGDLRSGKQLVGADGSIVTGTLAEVTQATPQISVSSGGLITASATQSGGIVEGGTKSSLKQLTTQAAKTVTPGTTTQTAVASGRYTTGDVVVAGDANLVPANIAQGVSIFGVTGTHSGGGGTLFFESNIERTADGGFLLQNEVSTFAFIYISPGQEVDLSAGSSLNRYGLFSTTSPAKSYILSAKSTLHYTELPFSYIYGQIITMPNMQYFSNSYTYDAIYM